VTALVVALTVAVALLGLLVVSLLRSHAEILRRLHEIDPAYDHAGGDHAGHDHGPTPVEVGVRPGVALPREHETPAHDVQGTTPAGGEVGLALLGGRASTLLAFLSSGCMTCHAIDKQKMAPSFKDVAKKYKGKPDAEQKLYIHLTTNPKVKVEGKEEEHTSLKTKKEADVRNVVRWILSR